MTCWTRSRATGEGFFDLDSLNISLCPMMPAALIMACSVSHTWWIRINPSHTSRRSLLGFIAHWAVLLGGWGTGVIHNSISLHTPAAASLMIWWWTNGHTTTLNSPCLAFCQTQVATPISCRISRVRQMEQADTHPIALPMGTENFNDCIGNNVWSSPCCSLLSCVIVIVPHSSDIKNGSSVSLFNSYTFPPL